jgi:cytochrome c
MLRWLARIWECLLLIRRVHYSAAFSIAVFCAFSDARAAAEIEAAKAQFIKSCSVCHSADPAAAPRQGPNLFGVIGRKSGSVPGYSYSPALAASGFVWTEKVLDSWIENAKAIVPGNNMPYRQADPKKRILIVEYLKSLKP